MTGWVCQWKPFWMLVDDSFEEAFVEDGVCQVTDTSDFSFPEVRVMLFLRLPRCRCLSHRHHGDHRKTRTPLVLGNVLRHHSSHYSRDLLVNVWKCSSPVIFCLAARILSQDLINLPCGERGHQEILAEQVVDIHKVVADFRDAFESSQSSSSQSHGVNKYFSSQSHMQKSSAFTTGTLGPDVERKMLSRNKLRESGISLLFKRLLNLSNMTFFKKDFT